MPVTFTQIEDALALVWAGKSLDVLEDDTVGTVSKTVRVYVDRPDPEEFTERFFPAIHIEFTDITPEDETLDSEDEIEVDYDDVSFPNVRTMRRNSIYYSISFEVHTWTLDAKADRDLMLWVETRLRTKDSIIIDGEYYWIFRSGGLTVVDEQDSDGIVYHKVWTYTVIADLENADTDQTFQVAHEIHLEIRLVKTLGIGGVCTPVDENNNPVPAVEAVNKLDFVHVFDSSFFFPV